MHWEPCEGCGTQVIIFDLTKTPTGYRCDECQKERVAELVDDPALQAAAERFIRNQRESDERHPLQKEFGFDKPEDGSERRFIFDEVRHGGRPLDGVRTPSVPWIKFRFWWWVHNVVAHSLIGVLPRRTFFKFHDYTSRKMHGK